MNTTDAGRIGEVKVLSALTELGWYPFSDLSGKCPVDIIAWKNDQTIRIQVKTTSYKPGKNYVVQIGSIRPNRTTNAIKKFNNTSADYLAVYVAPEDKVYFIPCETITSGRVLTITEKLESLTLAAWQALEKPTV